MAITPDQLSQLQTLVNKLNTDKSAEDAATATSDKANTDLVTAQTAVAAATATEQAAMATVATDLQTLKAFVDGLTA